MSVAAVVLGNCTAQLWGLSSRARIERQLRGVGVTVQNPEALPADVESVLVIDANYLFEVRTLSALLKHDGAVLKCAHDGRIAAALAPRQHLQKYLASFKDTATDSLNIGTILSTAELEAYDDNLRKAEPPLLEPISATNHAALESLLYGNSYKGITDLVTKWWWPRPAKRVVAWCARRQISPNLVTLVGLVLIVTSTVLFANGYFLTGLASGWLMTFLDTVDGKLARVTVQSSGLGHVLDHGTDIIHPPFWYVYWGLGLALTDDLVGFASSELAYIIVAGYVGGRIIEGLFEGLGACSMFAWRPFDAYFRLVTARRNPCLIILTLASLGGHPELGFVGVALWTALSSLLLLVRFCYACVVRLSSGPLESWLSHPELAAAQYPRAYRTFSATRQAYE
jgi:hypothetical protein